jgi:hypothetical protein
MTQKVLCIRLNSGEEVIGKLVQSNILSGTASQFDGDGPYLPTGQVTLENTRNINFQPINNDQFEIVFLPFVLGNPEGRLTFILDNCASSVYPTQEDIAVGFLRELGMAEVPAKTRPGTKI